MSETFDKVKGVHIFPIKGGQEATVDGSYPESLQVGPTGFVHGTVRDREFVVVDARPDDEGYHLFASQRSWDESERPVKGRHDNDLAAVTTDITPAGLAIGFGSDGLVLPAAYGRESTHQVRRNVLIHGHKLVNALDQGDEAADFFSQVLDREVRLVRASRQSIRWLPRDYVRTGASSRVAGADGFPFLFTSQASLDAAHLASGLELGTVPLSRYRGSVESDGMASGPWGEDYMRRVVVGRTIMHFVKPCTRCIVTNFDQTTGERIGKGLNILQDHRGFVEDDDRPKPLFGQNANHVWTQGSRQRISVGDDIVVLDRADEPNFVAA